MLNGHGVANEQIGDDHFEPGFRPFVSDELGVDIVRPVNISQQDNRVDLAPGAGRAVGRVDNVGSQAVQLLELALRRAFMQVWSASAAHGP